MKLKNLLNPTYVYKKRERIIPYLYKRAYAPVRSVQRYFALHGRPITQNDRDLLKLKNKHKGDRCFVIGNGPSLTYEDLERINREISFASNKIYLSFSGASFSPTYYTVEDDLVAINNADTINQISQTVKIFPEDLRYWLKPSTDVVYVNFIRDDKGFPKFSPDASHQVYWGSTVTYMNIELAYYMGIREVYLIGVDFSFSVPDFREEHVAVSAGEVNHFHPDYRKVGERWNLPRLDLQELAYKKAKSYFEENNGIIYNATRGGELEIFPRVDFDSLF